MDRTDNDSLSCVSIESDELQAISETEVISEQTLRAFELFGQNICALAVTNGCDLNCLAIPSEGGGLEIQTSCGALSCDGQAVASTADHVRESLAAIPYDLDEPGERFR